MVGDRGIRVQCGTGLALVRGMIRQTVLCYQHGERATIALHVHTFGHNPLTACTNRSFPLHHPPRYMLYSYVITCCLVPLPGRQYDFIQRFQWNPLAQDVRRTIIS